MRISAVIPTVGRPAPLARTVEALERQTVPPESIEVIVVADESVEDTSALAELLDPSRRKVATKLLQADSWGASAARNLGWRTASAPIVLFLGDDIVGVPKLIEEHLDWHERRGGPRVGVLGNVRWARELRATPFMRWLEHGYQFDYPSIAGDDASWFHFYTANISVPRSALEEVDGFDEERYPFGYEDLDLGYRLHERGFRLLYNRAADAEHLHAPTLESYRGRMLGQATAEHQWVTQRPEMPAYFHDKFAEAARLPRARGRTRALLRWIGPKTPVLGRRVWPNADVYFRQQLAPPFLERWAEVEREAAQAAGAGRENRTPRR